MAFVYLISEDTDRNLCKIGVTRSNDINKRIKALQTGNGNKLRLLEMFQSEHAFQLEKMLHFHYQREREEGEWFLLSDEQINEFHNVCVQCQSNIDALNKTFDDDIYI